MYAEVADCDVHCESQRLSKNERQTGGESVRRQNIEGEEWRATEREGFREKEGARVSRRVRSRLEYATL